MTSPARPNQQLIDKLNNWYARNARPLPWRRPNVSAWEILVSEVMSQQTPISRVVPRWEEWLDRWPNPASLATAPKSDVLKVWGNLGYPRRALRLVECAQTCVEKFDGQLPSTISELQSLPGIGSYTARSVAAYAFNQAVPVVDTNVRRVCHRAAQGNYIQGPPRARDLGDVADMMPWVDPDPALEKRGYSNPHHDRKNRDDALMMTASLMELGGLVCKARAPQCDNCPIVSECAWIAAGKPAPSEAEQQSAAKRVQKYAGTDRQVRGRVLKYIRESNEELVATSSIDQLWPEKTQLHRAIDSLVKDGLIDRHRDGYSLPS